LNRRDNCSAKRPEKQVVEVWKSQRTRFPHSHNLDGYGTDWRVVGAKTRSGNTAYHLERV